MTHKKYDSQSDFIFLKKDRRGGCINVYNIHRSVYGMELIFNRINMIYSIVKVFETNF